MGHASPPRPALPFIVSQYETRNRAYDGQPGLPLVTSICSRTAFSQGQWSVLLPSGVVREPRSRAVGGRSADGSAASASLMRRTGSHWGSRRTGISRP